MHFPGTLNSEFFENRECWEAAKSCVPAEFLSTKFFGTCVFAILHESGEFFDVLPFFVDQISRSVMLTDFGFADLAGGSRSPRRPGSAVRARKVMIFWRVFVFNIAHKCSLAKRNGRGVVYNISGNYKILFISTRKIILKKNMKIHPETRFRVHTPLLGLSWAICVKLRIFEEISCFFEDFMIFSLWTPRDCRETIPNDFCVRQGCGRRARARLRALWALKPPKFIENQELESTSLTAP